MTVYLVGAGPGDPGLLTRRGASLLARADVVVHDRLVDPAILALAPSARLVDVGKRPDDPTGGTARQEEIHALLAELGARHDVVVRLKGGDPFLFGRGGEEAAALAAAGVAWEVIPGVTSAFAVPALAGIPVTHRGLAASVTVVTGRVGEGREASEEGVDWESLARVGGTLVVLMGVATREAIAKRLLGAGMAAATPVIVVERGTTPDERVLETTLAGLPALEVDAPAVILIGEVAGFAAGKRFSGVLSGRSVVLTRPAGRNGVLADALCALGARTIEMPLLAIEAVDSPFMPTDLVPYTWIAFTSAEAVDRFVVRLRDGRDLAGIALAAVGPSTAAALARHHLVADLVAGTPTAAGLAEAMPEAPAGGSRVLFPCAEGAGGDLPLGLEAKGWEVKRVVTYRTVAGPPPSLPVLRAAEKADAIVFASPSAVAAFGDLRLDGGPVGTPSLVVCSGPTTLGAARSAGMKAARGATSPTPSGVLAALHW